jgi:sugar/nucleoside kinase (ribokinase family)
MSTKTLDLISIDKSWVDVLLKVPTLPQPDSKLLATPLSKQAGGAGGNVACAASRLGLRTGMVSWVGDDPDHKLILASLRKFGVDATHVQVTPQTLTNTTTILLDPSGEKSIIIVPAAFDTLNLTPELTTYLQQARCVYTTPYDPEQVQRIAQVVRPAGGLLVTDAEPVAGLADAAFRQILSLVEILFIDHHGLNGADPEPVARELQAAGPRLVVIGLGAGGALACDAGGVTTCPAFSVPVVDTTGAGDCFAAACLAAYLKGYPTASMLPYASAAAALSIQGYGARGALPTHSEVQAFLASEPRRR